MRELQEKSGVLKNEAPATIGKTGWDSGSLAARLSGSTRGALQSLRPRLSEIFDHSFCSRDSVKLYVNDPIPGENYVTRETTRKH